MSCEALKRWTGSLRFRLTLWNTAVVVFLMLVSLWAIREGLRLAVSDLLNEFLTEETLTAANDIAHLHQDPEELFAQLARRAWAHPRRGLFFEVFDESGKRLWASLNSPELVAALDPLKDVSSPIDLGEYRIVQRRLSLADAPARMLRVGCAEGAAAKELAHFTEPLLLIGGVVLVLIPLGGYLLAGRATRPLANMITTATKLHPANLNERLPVRRTQDELDQLALTINGFLDRIAQYLDQSRQFTDNVAHELRSPLAAMQFSLELALNADRSTEEYKEVLLGQLEECGYLRTLVNRLLVLAEGDAGLLCRCREPVRLDHTLLKSLEMFSVVAEHEGVHLAAPHLEPVLIQGDGNGLGQLVNNLIDNAIKFTPAGGTVTVGLSLHEAAGQGILKVADTGIGIAPEDLPHIFERFFQADKSREQNRQRRGTGLGLSICHALLSAHGGTVHVQSRLGKGTTFLVTLPGCSRAADNDQA